MKHATFGARQAPPGSGVTVAVRLMRRWVAARRADEAALTSTVTLGTSLGVSAQAAIALCSVFQLAEACLERPLQAECCCSPLLTADERAILVLLWSGVDADPFHGTPAIPHGLPGALAWATNIAARLLDVGYGGAAYARGRCPFVVAEPIRSFAF